MVEAREPTGVRLGLLASERPRDRRVCVEGRGESSQPVLALWHSILHEQYDEVASRGFDGEVPR